MDVRNTVRWWWYEGKRVLASDTEVTVTSAVATETAVPFGIPTRGQHRCTDCLVRGSMMAFSLTEGPEELSYTL